MQRTRKINLFKWFRRMSIGNKVTLLYSGFFSAIMIILSVLILSNTLYIYKSSSRQELNKTLEEITACILESGEVDLEKIKECISDKSIEIKITPWFGFIKDHHSGEQGINPLDNFPPPVFNEADNNKPRPQDNFKMGTINDKRYMFTQSIVTANDQKYYVQVFRPYYKEQQVLRFITIIFIVSNIFGIFLAFLIGRFISRTLLKPISDINNTAKAISINDLSRRIDVPEPNDEVRELAITFNDMISGLEDSVEKQKNFISDASHELRTPISIIQGYVNLIDRWGKTDSEILQESIDSIKAETEHMSNLVKKLLFLARAERTTGNIQGPDISLNAVFGDIVKDVKLVEEDIDISLKEENELIINTDLDLLKQTIWIFIDNALKYSKQNNKKILIRLYKEGGYAVFEIKDNGVGIREEDLPHIFDRFFRGDKSRSSETPGSGLGLSIAYRIIEGQKGKVKVESKFGEWTNFIISLPLSKQTNKPHKK